MWLVVLMASQVYPTSTIKVLGLRKPYTKMEVGAGLKLWDVY